MFKCKAAWDRATDEWIYKEKTCTSSSPKKKNWDAVPEGVNNTNGAETEAHSSIPGDAAHILLSVCSLLLCCKMSVYLFSSVCAWSVHARALQWNGVCVSPYVWVWVWVWHVYIACQLVARGSSLAGWQAWQKMTNQSSEKMRLSWHQSGTNLRINCSRVDKHTHMHAHTEEHLEPHRSRRGWLLFVCVFVHRQALLQRCVFGFFLVWEMHFFLI